MLQATSEGGLPMTMSALWFWEEEQQPLVLFWHGMRYGINIEFFRDVCPRPCTANRSDARWYDQCDVSQ
jgi:hypothetical protein